MVSYRMIFPLLASLFLLNGCSLGDKIEDEVKRLYEKAKEKYYEYRGEGEQEQPRPFQVVYQKDPSQKTPIFVSNCSANGGVGYAYFETPTDVSVNYFKKTAGLLSRAGGPVAPFWDIRYVNPVTRYIAGGTHTEYPDHSLYTGLDARSGSGNTEIGTAFAQSDPSGVVAQSECIGGVIAGGATINLYDAPVQQLYYAGPQETFAYLFDSASHISPWKTDGTGNLMIQASFKRPLYMNFENNIGGDVAFNVFLKNRRSGVLLNFVIAVYAFGDAWVTEKRGIQFDPTTNIVHVATVVSDDSWWSTKSPKSLPILAIEPATAAKNAENGNWGDFYRVNISYDNLSVVLQELQKKPPAGGEGRDFGVDPSEWEVTSVMIQYELEEKGGMALLSGSFKGFEAYISRLPL